MIESLLYSVLGFLVALGLAVAIAPALWRRAEYLERRRIEAALPLSREELEAEVAAVRAESAAAIRKLELQAEQLRKRSAADLVRLNVLNDRVRDLEEECANRDRTISRLEHEHGQLEARLAAKEEELQAQTQRVAELTRNLTEQLNRVQQLARLNDELNMLVSTQKIDLVAREADIDRLNNTNKLLRSDRRESDRIARAAEAERAELENALKLERSRAEDLQARIDRLLHQLSTRDQLLERQERELIRLGGTPIAAELQQGWQEVIAPQAHATGESTSGERNSGAAEMGSAEMDDATRLQQRIAALTSAHRGRGRKPANAVDEEALREEISAIAAEMVRMVADREGPGSAIESALASPVPEFADAGDSPRPESLADRVGKLRNAS